MYRSDKRYHKHAALLRFSLYMIPIIIVGLLLAWWFLFRDSQSSVANFDRIGGERVVDEEPMKEFKTEYFTITLPATWVNNGRKNPYSYEVYYEYQNKLKDNDNQWLRVYVDTFRRNEPINRLLPITVTENRIVPGVLSDDCVTFTGAPAGNNGGTKPATWAAKWQDISFVCDLATPQNVTGTASAAEGSAVTLVGAKSGSHKYFFTYRDFNVRPNYQLLSNALKSFEPQ